jgi:hypothetical protein
MRPTLLHFRSPKERTPDPYNPDVTYDGRKISYSPDRSRTIGLSPRFPQYKEAENRTTFIVGPGSYENDSSAIAKSQVRSVFRYTKPHCGKQTGNNGYFMVGDHLVFDANLMTNRGKHQVTDPYCKVDETTAFSSRNSRPPSTRAVSRLLIRRDQAGSTSPRRLETPLYRRSSSKRETPKIKKSQREKTVKEFNRLFEFRFKTLETLLKS